MDLKFRPIQAKLSRAKHLASYPRVYHSDSLLIP